MQFECIGKSTVLMSFFPSHRHRCWEMIYNVSGEGTMNIDGINYAYQAGTIILCPPGKLHTKASGSSFLDYYVQFSDCQLSPRVYVLTDDYEKKILQLLQILYNIYHERYCKTVYTTLFSAIMGIMEPAIDRPIPDQHVQKLRSAIISQFTNPEFSLQEIEKSIPLSSDYLRKKFKQEIGLSPRAYLTSMRVEHAKQLLSQSQYEHLSIAEIALRSGYYDPLYFSRVFRKYTGMSPSCWDQ